MRAIGIAMALLIVSGGCTKDNFTEGLACDDGDCPPGQMCGTDNICRSVPLDAAATVDADVNAVDAVAMPDANLSVVDAAALPDASITPVDAATVLDASMTAIDAAAMPDAAPIDAMPDAMLAGCPGYSYEAATGHWYRSGGPLTIWFDARAACEAGGGYLAVIGNEAENTIVRGHGGAQAYIGLTDLNFDATFEWNNGEPLVYTNWNVGAGQPDGGACVAIISDGTWYDLGCSVQASYVCECDGL